MGKMQYTFLTGETVEFEPLTECRSREPQGVCSTTPGFGAAIKTLPLPPLPERFYVADGADFGADFTISWTELDGVPCKPMSIAKIIDAAMTRDFVENGPAPQVAAPLPVFAPKRAKPAMAGLMVEADGKASGIGFCAGD